MIEGIGIDIVEVSRVEKAVKRLGFSFLKRIFTDKEIKNSKKRKWPYEYLAARFATKEAVFKALNDGLDGSISWRNIEILNDKDGRPVVTLYGQAKKLQKKKKVDKIHVSVSHIKEYAIATAALVRKNNEETYI
jgi:holo-[acyl-carrier protein] synthase